MHYSLAPGSPALIHPCLSIADKLAEPKALQRLAIGPDAWLGNMPRIEKDFHHCIAQSDAIKPLLNARSMLG